jgi:flagellar motor switch protein FliG
VSESSLAPFGLSPPPDAPVALTRRQKAAVIVRLLVTDGADLPISALSEDQQAALTEAMAQMRAVDRATLRTVIEEFVAELEAVGLSFSGGIDGALALLEGQLSSAAACRVRRLALAQGAGDPWARIAALPPERLLAALQSESTEVGAVILSKLAVVRAAELLGRLPGDRARSLARAIAETSAIAPHNVRRIGIALLDQIDSEPLPAFDTTPVERVGAILNSSPAATRDDVLAGLEEEDRGFAALVRKAIFTFPDISRRIDARDVPRIVKQCDPRALVTALAAAMSAGQAEAETAEFLLSNMSQRMAGQLREEVADRGSPKEADGEAAMSSVIMAIRELETRGEIVMAPAPD